ncbi:hypothetical protein K443DRAFT_105684, partial [Laccaria amethystina LaAM-08-1]
VTIFGNVHRPCKHYSNIVNNHHVNSTPITIYIISIIIFLFLADFLSIFALLTIFGNVHRPCKQCPNNNTTLSLFSF